MEEIFFGVFSGVVTALLILLAKAFFQTYITPYYRSIRYSGVDVSGGWLGENVDDDRKTTVKVRLFISQNAHDLGGAMVLEYRSPEKAYILDFLVSGYIWEGYLTLNFKPKDKRILSYAVGFLRIAGGGEALEGYWCFRDVTVEKPMVEGITLIRESPINGIPQVIPGSVAAATTRH